MRLAFLCLLAGVVLFGGFHGLLSVREGTRKDWIHHVCSSLPSHLLALIGWDSSNKHSKVGCHTSVTWVQTGRQAVALVLYEVRVTLPTAPVKRTCSLLQTSKVLFWFQAWRHRSYNKRFFIGIDSSMKNL